MKRSLALIIVIALLSHGCAAHKQETDEITFKKTPPLLTDRDRREVELGEQLHQKIVNSFPIYRDPEVNDYVRDVGSKLTPYAKRENLPYTFTILEDNRIYASSAPGGYIYITTGFLNILENEAELAAVLGHEIAQVQYRPPDPRVRTFVMNSKPILAMAAGMFLGVFTPFAMIGVDALTYYTMLEKKKSDRAVRADRTAFDYMVKAGYDPQGAIDLFYHLMDFDETTLAMIYNYNISHPLTNKRFAKMLKTYSELEIVERELVTDRNDYYEHVRKIKEMYQDDENAASSYRALPVI
ncbi:MAG: M48 family metalloprotease [Candidatus Omnitrophica bacterium]|nr:M48 family metalloprotease [Candidatus Omnitrophota bacterium]